MKHSVASIDGAPHLSPTSQRTSRNDSVNLTLGVRHLRICDAGGLLNYPSTSHPFDQTSVPVVETARATTLTFPISLPLRLNEPATLEKPAAPYVGPEGSERLR